MDYFSRENNVRPKRITPAALEALQRLPLEGQHPRAAEHRRAADHHDAPATTIDVADLPERACDRRGGRPRRAAGAVDAEAARGGTLREFKDNTERAYLVAKLRENGWNISKTAEVIDTPRSNLYKKLEQYQISQETDG